MAPPSARKSKISLAWTYFDKVEDRKVRCTLCNVMISFCLNTTNMLNHLRLKHKDLSVHSKRAAPEVTEAVDSDLDEETGNGIDVCEPDLDPETGRFIASHKPVNITYEVEQLEPSPPKAKKRLSSLAADGMRIKSEQRSCTPGPSKRKTVEPKQDDYIEMACAKLTEANDGTSVLARSWASQYSELSSRQRVLSRKIISDVLFHGCLEHLDEDTVREIQKLLDARKEESASWNGPSSPPMPTQEVYVVRSSEGTHPQKQIQAKFSNAQHLFDSFAHDE